MDLAIGVTIESPPAVVRWGSTPSDVLALLPSARTQDGGALAADVVWLDGLAQTLRFFFNTEAGGLLSSTEAGGVAGRLTELDVAFNDLQARLVAALGPPTGVGRGPFEDRYPDYSWEIPGATVRHWVIDGPATDHALAIQPR